MDRIIAELAARQLALVERLQLLALGLTRGMIGLRLRNGRLHRIHRNVYAVAPPRTLRPEAHRLAAVLALGPGAVLSHRSAAVHLGLLDGTAWPVDVSVNAIGRRSRRGIAVHAARLRPPDVVVHRTVPCTAWARTVLDLAATSPPRTVERALDQAVVLHLFDTAALDAVLGRDAGHQGAQALRAVLVEHVSGSTRTRSELEEALIALCDSHELPRPETNAIVDGFEVDAVWRRSRLVVEADGARFHASRRRRRADLRKQEALEAAGWRVLRVGWNDVVGAPRRTAEVLRAALAAGGP